MTDSSSESLDVRVVYKVHPGLSIDIAFQLGAEIGIIFGPSGAGKSTLLRLIAGLTRPDSGHVKLDGAPLFDSARSVDQPLRRRQIGMIFQDDCLFPHLNVAANIRFGLKRWRREQARARLDEMAALCGLERLLDRRPDTLSGGERQRVGLARALAPRPRLLLCDEPVSALDVSNRHALIDHIRSVQRAEAIPVLYVTHSPAEAISLGSRLFSLEAGRIVADGPPLDVLTARRAASAGPHAWHEVNNIFAAAIVGHAAEQTATHVQLDGGPELIVPFMDRTPGTRVMIEVRADDILLARQPMAGLSARNQMPATLERIVRGGHTAEAVVRTGDLTWIVSLVAPAIDQLELEPGVNLRLIIKARSCQVIA